MSKENPTNRELAIMMENHHGNLYEKIDRVEDQIKIQNGQVKKNTEWRLRHAEKIAELIRDKQDTDNRMKTFFWKVVGTVVALTLGLNKIL